MSLTGYLQSDGSWPLEAIKMARHAQPRELAELKGATAKDPQRYRKQVPKSNLEVGKPPEHMTAESAECWWEILAKAIPGTITFADSIMLEITCDALAEYREAPREFNTTRLTALIGLLARFGFSPSDRTKLGIEKPDDDDDFGTLN